jgi:hypothetical protein
MEKALRGIRPERGRYSDEQVNWIRESYLLDGISLKQIRSQLWPVCSINALWRIAIGRAYTGVPLSARLAAAAAEAEQKRRAPTTLPQRAVAR